MTILRRHTAPAAAALAVVLTTSAPAGPGDVVRPADELLWTPTLEQAVAMATANDVPVFVMGYSLVGDRSTYTKFSEDCASTVF